jgi:hypothetical protein
MVGESGRRLSSATMTRSWSPWSAGKGMFRERLVSHAADAGLISRAANPSVASVRSGMTRPVPQGVGACGGKGCRDGLRGAAGARWWG